MKTTPVVTVPATCITKGSHAYVAEFASGAFEAQAKTAEDIDIDENAHGWDDAAYAWADDCGSVTATSTCVLDHSHVAAETAKTASEVTKAATCTEKGETTYTAAFESSAFATQTETLANVAALGHDWGEWEVTTPATEASEGVETRTCARCGQAETRAIPMVLAYRYVGADDPSWQKGSADALTLTFKRSLDDGLTFGLFDGIEVDGATVPATGAGGRANYTAEAGSLVLHLQPAYLEALPEGDHALSVLFEDGSVQATFTVKAAPASTKAAAAKTGDAPALPAALGALSVAALAALLAARRKRRA